MRIGTGFITGQNIPVDDGYVMA